jgi:hypothetical protein
VLQLVLCTHSFCICDRWGEGTVYNFSHPMLWFCNAHIILPCLESVRPIHETHPAVHESALLMSAFNVSGLNHLLRVQGASTISSHYYHMFQTVRQVTDTEWYRSSRNWLLAVGSTQIKVLNWSEVKLWSLPPHPPHDTVIPIPVYILNPDIQTCNQGLISRTTNCVLTPILPSHLRRLIHC